MSRFVLAATHFLPVVNRNLSIAKGVLKDSGENTDNQTQAEPDNFFWYTLNNNGGTLPYIN